MFDATHPWKYSEEKTHNKLVTGSFCIAHNSVLHIGQFSYINHQTMSL